MKSLIINTIDGIEFSIFDNDSSKSVLLYNLKESKNDINVANECVAYLEKFTKGNNITFKDFSFIGVVTGPGYFTGIRIGIVLAKTLQFSLKIPAIGVSSLLVLAQESKELESFDYLIATCDIGKKEGAVFAIYDKALNVIFDTSYHSMFNKEIFSKIAKDSKVLIVGQRQNFLYEQLLNSNIDSMLKQNLFLNKNIQNPSPFYINLIALLDYKSNQNLREIEALYGKDADVIKPV